MAYGKWIGATLGYLCGGIIGAIAGFALGALAEALIDQNSNTNTSNTNTNTSNTNNNRRAGIYENSSSTTDNGDRNGFLFALMLLAAHIIQADGKIMHSEMEYVRRFLRNTFGDVAKQEGDNILHRLFDYRKQCGEAEWNRQIVQACQQMAYNMPEEHRLQLLAFLSEIAKADGHIDGSEVTQLRRLANQMNINPDAINQMLSLGEGSLDDAYKALGISPDATDDEVKKAYRKMALQYHPDRVNNLGPDVVEAAKKKFQEINAAKDMIYKARGL